MNALGKQGGRVLEFLRELYARQSADAFVEHIVRALPRLISTDMTSFNEVDPSTGKSRTLVSPAGADRFPGSEEIFEHYVRQHPYVVHVQRFQDGRAYRISDFVRRAGFVRLALYNEYYRRIGTEHQLAIALPWAAPWVRGIALSRGSRDYSETERGLLTALGPHMVQAYQNADALGRWRRAAEQASGTDTAAPSTDAEVVLLSATGGIYFATPRVRRWFAWYFRTSGTRDARLPATVADWVRVQRAGLDDEDVPVRRPLAVERDGARLEIRLCRERGQRALLVRERRRLVSAGCLAALGLSPREAQVLAWVAEGKTNGEIGVILGARPRTVAKHLERIFRKLGVETRTAAAACALGLAAS